MLADGTLVASRYRILCKQGSNRYLEEYDAEDLVNSRVLALKIVKQLPPLTDSDADRLEYALHGVRVVDHPLHTGVLDVVIHEGSAVLIADRHRGERLYLRIDRGEVSTPVDALRIGVQLLEYLSALHAAGVVHQDVRPGTILREVMEFGRVEYRLLNTGVAQILGEWSSEVQRAPGMIRRFSCPERLRGEPVGPEGDLYGVGATLWACLEQRAPFLGSKTEFEIIGAMTRRSCLEVSSPAVPEGLKELIRRLTAMNPADRFDSAEAALAFIREDLAVLYQSLDEEVDDEREDFVGRVSEFVSSLFHPMAKKPDEELGKKGG